MRARVIIEGGRQYEFAREKDGVVFRSVSELGVAQEGNRAILATFPLLKPGLPMVIGFVTGVVGNYGVVRGVRYTG